MPLRVLVCSQPGGGKTTCCTRLQQRIRTVLPQGSVIGFLSREKKNSSGYKVGYELYALSGEPCETLASAEGPESGVMVSRYHVYLSAVERVALPQIDAALAGAGPRVFVLDDIGNMTCRSDKFVAGVRRLIESPDSDLHVLAAVGYAGDGFSTECRRMAGVTSVILDEESRDAKLESLTARFMSALVGGGSESDEEAEGAEAEDLTEFDQWGGDRRQLGARRGMYDPARSPQDARDAQSAELSSTRSSLCPAQGEGRESYETSRNVVSSAGPRDCEVVAVKQNGLGIIEWLGDIDFFLLVAYGKAMKDRFAFASEVADAYMQTSDVVSERFFQDFGVTKLGHRRLFQKWFREEGRVVREAVQH